MLTRNIDKRSTSALEKIGATSQCSGTREPQAALWLMLMLCGLTF